MSDQDWRTAALLLRTLTQEVVELRQRVAALEGTPYTHAPADPARWAVPA